MYKNIKKQLSLIFGIFYFIPFVYLFFDKNYVSNFYRGDVGSFSILFFSILFFISTFYFSKIRFKNNFFVPGFLFREKYIIFFSLIYLIASVFFYLNYGYQFRQTGSGLSSGGSFLFILLILKNYFKVVLFINILRTNSGQKLINNNIISIFIALSFFLSLTGSLDVILIFFTLVLIFRKQLFVVKTKFNHYLYFISLIISVVFIGISNKLTFSTTMDLFKFENILIIVRYVIKRISTWAQSVEVVGEKFLFSFTNSFEIVTNIFQNMVNRLSVLFGGEKIITNTSQSLSRENYILLFQDNTNELTGASPGIVASTLLFFPFGFLIISFVFSRLLIFVNEKIHNNNLIVNLFVIIVIYYPFLASPIDLLNFISPAFAFLFFLVFSSSIYNEKI